MIWTCLGKPPHRHAACCRIAESGVVDSSRPCQVHVVVAVKGMAHGKHRLGSVLSAEDRRRLVLAMLEDVLSTLRATRGVRDISVLTHDRSLLSNGLRHIDDDGRGLNAAITHAASVVSRSGVQSMLILPADLPFVTPDDIEVLLLAGESHVAVLAPDAQGSGTNALLLSPPTLVRPRFGQDSCAAHAAAIRAMGASLQIIERPGLACDIDLPTDLAALANKRDRRYAFLAAALKKAS